MSRRLCFSLFALLGSIGFGEAGKTTTACATPVATIASGVVNGTTTSLPYATAVVNKFLGIPFAQSPPERFSPPQPPKKWLKPLNATAVKPACIQQFVYPLVQQEFTKALFDNPAVPESEDCLYLNVFAPAAPAAGKGRAVMYWIYGGSLQFGDAGIIYYDGSHFAAYEDVIVVTVNYRTNVFGFPSSPELPLDGHNLGFLDQRLGLQWVQENIHAFGGDKNRVTIFGESAGAFSVDALLTSYPKHSKPPFQAAILQSGQYSYRASPFVSTVPAWNALAAALNCPKSGSNLACIRKAPATQIKQIIEENILTFQPVPDGKTLISNPASARESGNIANIPVLGGTNAQEGRVFTVGQNNITAYIEATFPGNATLQAAIAAAYPLGQNGLETPYDVISQIFTEFIFQCSAARWANASAAAGISTWRYYFNASFPNTQAYPGLGVYHSSEIPLVFSTYPTPNTTAQEYALSIFMRGTWARFAKDPLAGPGWNALGTGNSFLGGAADLVLGDIGADGSSGVTIIRESLVDYRCGLWDPIYNKNNGK